MTSGKLLTSETHWSSVQRPLYSPGLLLEDEDLNIGIAYTQSLIRLMLRSLFGCGVICGLKVTAVPTCNDTKRRIDVTKGVAVDGEGNLIEVSRPWSYEFGPDCDDGFPDNLWVVVCYTEKCCRPRDVDCGSDDDGGSKPTRVRAGYKINVQDHPPECACRCPSPDDEEPDDDDPHYRCCHGSSTKKRQRTAEGGDTATTVEDPCACYTDHFNGECDCECGCRCVVLAKIVDPGTIVTEENNVALPSPVIEVDSSMVRKVRPVLNGYLQCLCPDGIACRDTTPPQTQDDSANEDIQLAAARIRSQRQAQVKERQKAKTVREDKTKAPKGTAEQIKEEQR